MNRPLAAATTPFACAAPAPSVATARVARVARVHAGHSATGAA